MDGSLPSAAFCLPCLSDEVCNTAAGSVLFQVGEIGDDRFVFVGGGSVVRILLRASEILPWWN